MPTLQIFKDKGCKIKEVKAASIYVPTPINETLSISPLSMSCFGGKEEMVLFLLDEGCDPTSSSDNGQLLPLHLSILTNNLDVASKLYFDYGCDPSDLDPWKGFFICV